MPCTIYIDESGDAGITTIRSESNPGSSDYFVLAAAVFQPATEIVARKLLDELQEKFRKKKRWKHATDLNHSQKLHFCQSLAKLNVRLFGVISYKPTLQEYANTISHEPHKFYNKCSKYLFEQVGAYLKSVDNRLSEPRIVFEERNHDYDAMIRYISKVKENPIYQQSNALDCINPFAITSEPKKDEDLLRIADLVAHAIYSCVNKTPENFGITEPRYFRELSKRFAPDSSGKILGTGLKPIHCLADLKLDADISKEFVDARAMPLRQRKRA